VTRFKIDSSDFQERENDYTASFTCENMETGGKVDITLRQDKAKPAADLVNSLRALAQLFIRINTSGDEDTNTVTLN
jgi:hypothetical protein